MVCENTKRKPRGRRSAFKPAYIEQGRKLCQLGATDAQIANFFGVNKRTVNRWKKRHPEFCQALKSGKAAADARLADNLVQLATANSHKAIKTSGTAEAGEDHVGEDVERLPLDLTAGIFWLKNRRPDLSRDKIPNEHAGKDGAPIGIKDETVPIDDRDLARRIALILYRADKKNNKPDQES